MGFGKIETEKDQKEKGTRIMAEAEKINSAEKKKGFGLEINPDLDSDKGNIIENVKDSKNELGSNGRTDKFDEKDVIPDRKIQNLADTNTFWNKESASESETQNEPNILTMSQKMTLMRQFELQMGQIDSQNNTEVIINEIKEMIVAFPTVHYKEHPKRPLPEIKKTKWNLRKMTKRTVESLVIIAFLALVYFLIYYVIFEKINEIF